MAKLFASQNGYYFEIRETRLMYLSPAPLEDLHKNAIELVQLLYAWFLVEVNPAILLTEDADDQLAAQFSDIMQAELVVDRLPRQLCFKAA